MENAGLAHNQHRPHHYTILMKYSLLLLAATSGLALAGTVPPPPPATVPPPPAAAPLGSSFNYDFLEIGWLHSDIESVGESDGSYAGLTLSPMDNLLLYANWADAGDLRSIGAGVGSYLSLCSEADLVVKAGYSWNDADYAGQSGIEDNSIVVSVGIRIAITEWLEFYPSYLLNIEDGGDTYNTAVGTLLFDIGTDVQLAINGSIDDNQTTFGAGIRYNF